MRKPICLLLLTLILLAGPRAFTQCDAAFTVSVNANMILVQADTSGPGIGHDWNFGTGYTYHTTQQYFPFSYSQPGTYTIHHIVYDTLNNCLDSATATITLNFSPLCNAAFTYSQDSTGSNMYQFMAPAPPAGVIGTEFFWYDNGVLLSSASQFNTVLLPGDHIICLNVYNNYVQCYVSHCDTIVVAQDPCNVQASFTYQPSPTMARLISFTGSPAQSGHSYLWNFDDGYTSWETDPVHFYYQPGTYEVSLKVFQQGTMCTDSVMQTITVHPSAMDSCTASFSYSQDPSDPGEVTLMASSNQPIVSQIWFIRNLADSLGQVSYYYSDTLVSLSDSAVYQVCLTISTSSNCAISICDTITIVPSGGRPSNMIPSYPNPASSSVKLDVHLQQSDAIVVTVYNSHGIEVFKLKQHGLPGRNQVRIPVSQLSKGQYFVDIQYGRSTMRSRFMKL